MVKPADTRAFTAVFLSNAFNNALALALSIWAATLLGLDGFGVLGVAISVTTVTSLLFDFGLSGAMIAQAPAAGAAKERLFASAVTLKLGGGLLALLLGWPIAVLATTLLPIVADAFALMYLAVVSGALHSLWFTFRAVEQAQGRFQALAGLTLGYAGLRCATAGAIVLVGGATPLGFHLALYGVPLVILLVPQGLRAVRERGLELAPDHRRRLLAMAPWLGVSALLFACLPRLPQLVLAWRGTAAEVGLYSAALTFVSAFALLNDSLRTVIWPRAVALTDRADRARFRGRLWRATPIFFAVITLALAGLAWVQVTTLGPVYQASVSTFVLLGAATALTMYVGLYNTVLLAMGEPAWDMAANATRVLGLVAVLALVPTTAWDVALAYGLVLVLGEVALMALILLRERVPREVNPEPPLA